MTDDDRSRQPTEPIRTATDLWPRRGTAPADADAVAAVPIPGEPVVAAPEAEPEVAPAASPHSARETVSGVADLRPRRIPAEVMRRTPLTEASVGDPARSGDLRPVRRAAQIDQSADLRPEHRAPQIDQSADLRPIDRGGSHTDGPDPGDIRARVERIQQATGQTVGERRPPVTGRQELTRPAYTPPPYSPPRSAVPTAAPDAPSDQSVRPPLGAYPGGARPAGEQPSDGRPAPSTPSPWGEPDRGSGQAPPSASAAPSAPPWLGQSGPAPSGPPPGWSPTGSPPPGPPPGGPVAPWGDPPRGVAPGQPQPWGGPPQGNPPGQPWATPGTAPGQPWGAPGGPPQPQGPWVGPGPGSAPWAGPGGPAQATPTSGPALARPGGSGIAPWGLREIAIIVVGGLAATVALVLAVIGVLEASGRDTGDTMDPLVFLGFGAAQYLGFGLAIWAVLIRWRRLTWADLGFRPTTPLRILAMIPLAVGMTILVGAVALAQDALFGISAPEDSGLPLEEGDVSTSAVLAVLLVAVVLAPFFEELFFRGILFQYLRSRYLLVARGLFEAVVISALAFATLHLGGSILPILPVGVVLALVMHRTNSLWPPIALHMFYNGLVVVLNLIALSVIAGP